MKKAISAVLSLGLIVSSISPVLAAENNMLEDSFTKPAILKLVDTQNGKKGSVSNTLDSENKLDYYKLVLTEDQKVYFKLSGLENQKINFTVMETNENRIIRTDVVTGGYIDQEITLAKGEYIIEINLRNSRYLDYTLDIETSNPESYYELEPNNSLESANYIPLNTTLRAHAHVSMDYDFGMTSRTWESDYFKFDVPLNGKYGIKYISDSGLSRRIYLYDEFGKYINEFNSDIQTFNLTPGTYYLDVQHLAKNGGDYQIEVAEVKFKDVTAKHPSVKEIAYLSDLSVIKGYEDGTFKPDNYVTKAQAASMVVKALGLDTSNRPVTSYKDISNNWARDAIRTLVDEGIIQDGTTFNPNENLTRGEMASILVKAFKLEGVSSKEFTDVPKASSLRNVISALAANNITTGYEDNTFKPNYPLTRAHFSVFLSRALDDRYKK